MNITYTGKQEYLHPKQKEQLDTKLNRIAKLLEVDGKGDKNAHVILAQLKNHHRAEITLNYLDQTLVGEHSDVDQFTALNQAVEKLERQILKSRDRRRDLHKGSRESWDRGAAANDVVAAEPSNEFGVPAADNGRPRVYRVAPSDGKPLTLDEAMMLIDDDPYMVYRDAGTQRVSVLVRRGDGNFDLVECG